MEHILIKKAFIYNISADNSKLYNGYNYDEKKGYWINCTTGVPLMLEENGYKPRTKKEDVETGEDRKGE